MTIPLPPALPPHFNIGGYKITALVESGPDYHLYQALSPEGHAVLIREFCPRGLVTRDLASGELAVFPENESQFAQAREAFETQYAANAESKLRGFGTVLFLYHFRAHSGCKYESRKKPPHLTGIRRQPYK